MSVMNKSRAVGSHNSAALNQHFVDQVNGRLEVLYGQLNDTPLPDFGGDMLCCSTDSIIACTVAHRFLGKFQKPDTTTEEMLHQKCISEWLATEDRFSAFSWSNVKLSSKSVLYRARVLLDQWTENFRPTPEVCFTPGETLVSNRGRVSVYQKLRRKENWTVTHDAFEDFARLVYNTRWLKKVAKTFFHKLNQQQYRRLYSVFKDAKHVGYAVFRHRFETEVVTLVHGGRFASVYKNNDKRRPIIVGPLGNMLLQRGVSLPLREILRSIGNDLEVGQDIHRNRISDPTNATIDFSNASDSNLLKVVVEQFPSRIHRLLSRYRDPMVLVDDVYYVPHKLSSMGCGFTFEVMTLLLLSIARVLDPQATVYGDDVIIKNDVAEQFMDVMRDIMWKVNDKKTFVNSPFRESCGAFYHDAYGYITCFDFRWVTNVNDAIITMNKLKMISDSNVPIIGGLFRSAYEDLLFSVPSLLLAPVREHVSDPDLGFVMCDHAVKRQRRDRNIQPLWSRCKARVAEIVERFNLDKNDVCLVLRPKFVNKLASKVERSTRDTPRIAQYLYDGLVNQDNVRFAGEWRSSLYVVTRSAMIPINITVDESARFSRMTQAAEIRLAYSVVFSAWVLHTNPRLWVKSQD